MSYNSVFSRIPIMLRASSASADVSVLKHVLVVDDDDGTRDTFRIYLHCAGVRVSAAPTGLAALDALRQSPADLVLCDLVLPDMSGLDILRWLRMQALAIPFVIMTGFATSEAAVEAGRLGVTDLWDKPVGIEKLQNLVDTYLTEDDSETGARGDRGRLHAVKAQGVVQNQYGDPDLCLRAVADVVGISEQHLCRVFKHHVGTTFAEALRDTRLSEACRLMQDDGESLKAIAYRVGFRDPSQFTRAFRVRYGVPPTIVRRRMRVHQRQVI